MARFTKKGPRVVPPEPAAPESQPGTEQTARPAPPNVRNKGKESFWHKVREIPKEEWGKRAWIYVYCLEPVCNLKTAGENKYLVKSAEPITDEDSIMHDYGSGKYRLNLVYRKPAADRGDEVDATEIEIYNPKYPPKIPRTAWMNDPRNERWAALLPKEEPPVVQSGLGQVTEAFKTFTEIQKEVRQQNPPPVAQSDDMEKFTGMVSAVKSLLPSPAPATDNAMLNTVVTLLTAQINYSQQEAAQLRKQVFDLITTRQNETNGIEAIIEKADSWLPKLKGLLNLGGDKLTEVVHGRPRQWWQELVLGVAPPLVQQFAPFIPMMVTAGLSRNGANGNGMNGNVVNGAAPQQQHYPQASSHKPPRIPCRHCRLKSETSWARTSSHFKNTSRISAPANFQTPTTRNRRSMEQTLRYGCTTTTAKRF